MLQKWYTSLLLLLVVQLSTAQPCNLIISGNILDKHDNSPLDYATIYILETQQGATADSAGRFTIDGLCAGTYTLLVEHLGCTPDTQVISLSRSVTKKFYLEHHAEELAEVVALSSRADRLNTSSISSLKGAELENLKGKDLGSIVSNLSGVRLLKTGSSISKPIIHGLYGDRVNIISGGLMLESQDWGSEHAPEIDPNTAQEIKVVKGTGSLEYNTQALGGLILLEPTPLSLHSQTQFGLSIVEQSNGWSNGISGYLGQGFNDKFAYRIQGTYKRSGDQRAPGYVQSNSGQQEGDLKFLSKWAVRDWNFQANYSLFSQRLGILSASHIGNVTDLLNAISSDKPIIIRDATFNIINPQQQVSHQVAELKVNKDLHQAGFIDLRMAIQSNRRQEFDIRRGGRSETPALDMRLNSFDLRPSYQFEKTYSNGWHYTGKTGASYQYKFNYNNPETGIVPLIPDYMNNQAGLFSTHQADKESFLVEAGFRYEWNRFIAYTFNDDELVLNRFNYHNFAFTAGAKWMHDHADISTNLGMTRRNPNASELFSSGLHHGLAVLEFGDPDLQSETAIQWQNQFDLHFKEYISAEFSVYINSIRNFIYLAPDSLPALTIRGAFPVFHYEQTKALLYGFDLQVSAVPYKCLKLGLKSSIVRGRNQNTNDWLIYMPADNIRAHTEIFTDWKKMEHIYLKAETEYVFRQKRTPDLIKDLKPVPDAYTLLNLETGARFRLAEKHMLGLSLTVENALNKKYRDYLNRFRYYTDETGLNVILRLNYTFG